MGESNIMESTMNKFDSKEVAWCITLWIVFILGLLVFASFANAQTWDWSPPAAHHAAVCKVQNATGRGSGIYIKHGDLRGVLTAAHITEGQNTEVTFSDGTKATGKSTIDKFGHDVAFIFVTHSALLPVPMAITDPKPGERVEFLTVGGPERRLRTFWATIQAIRNKVTEYDCDVLSGDSGGGILNIQAQLIGIQSVGFGKNILTDWNGGAYRGSGSASCKPIRDFLRRVAKCGPKGCPKKQGGAQFYPPSPKLIPVQKPVRPVVRPPVKRQPANTPPGFSIDYDKLVKMILAKINPADFRGPAGPQGLIGGHGPVGPAASPAEIDINDLAKQVKKRISGSIRIKVRPIPSR